MHIKVYSMQSSIIPSDAYYAYYVILIILYAVEQVTGHIIQNWWSCSNQ